MSFPKRLKGSVKRRGETVSGPRRAWWLKQSRAGAQEAQTMRSDPRVGAICPADAAQVWAVRSVRRGAKLWLHAVPGPGSATGPEKMPELVRVRFNSDGTKPRAAHKAAHGVLNQVPRRAGTPDDLNDSIWTIGPTSAVTSVAARPGLHVSLDVYRRAWRRQRRTVPTPRTGVPGLAATGVQGPSFRA